MESASVVPRGAAAGPAADLAPSVVPTQWATFFTILGGLLSIFAGLGAYRQLAELPRIESTASSYEWLQSAPQVVSPALVTQLQEDGWVTIREAVPVAVIDAFRSPLINATTAITDACLRCGISVDLDALQCHGCSRTAATPPLTPKSFVKARNLHRIDTASRPFLLSHALAKIASDLLNVSAVRLYQDTAFFKEPGDVESAWHQDQAAAPLDTDRFLTLWIPLEDVSQQQGTLMFARGSHTMPSPLTVQHVPRASRVDNVRYLRDADMQRAFRLQSSQALRVGDLTAHFGWTFHRASGNPTGKSRRAIALSYFEDGAGVYEDLIHVGAATGRVRGVELSVGGGSDDSLVVQLLTDDTSTWMPWLLDGEMVPGHPVKTPMAPLLYSRRPTEIAGGSTSGA